MELNQSQKHFLDSVSKGIMYAIDSDESLVKTLEENKSSLTIEDSKVAKAYGIKINDSMEIADNTPYVEYELVKVSQRIFERPQANQPFLDLLYSDSEGSQDQAIIYKYVDYKGGFTVGVDKGAANSIVSTKHGAESYSKIYLSAYLEDISLYEIAVAIAKGYELNARMLKALYVAYEKTLNTVIFSGTDSNASSVGKYSLNAVATDTVTSSADTWKTWIDAGTSIKIYTSLVEKIALMEANGELAEGQFTPNCLVLPVLQFSLLRNLMENAGQFRGSIKEYLEMMLGLEIKTYAPLKTAGAAGVARALLMNTAEDNLFYGLPNPLSVYEDQKFDVHSKKAVFQTTGLIVINDGAISAIDGI